MCKIASDFLKNDQLRKYSEHQSTWHRLQSFVRSVHSSLDVKDTVYAIANEGRRVLDCDRVSLALNQNYRQQVQIISGLDTIERRADQVKRLSRLATTVARAGEPLWYSGDDSDLPPQIEKQLQHYLDLAHSKLLVIQPLQETIPVSTDTREPDGHLGKRKVIGVLIAEQLGDNQVSPILRKRLEVVSQHAGDALTNALNHSQMFLAPLWTWLGKTAAVTHARNLPKTIAVVAVVLGIVAAFCLIPYPFTLSANGRLTPESQIEVFANIDGVLQRILVPEQPGELVQANQVLAVMTNNDLLVAIQNLQGQLQQSEEQVKKLQRAQHARMNQVEHRMIEGDLAEAMESRDSLGRQLQLKLHQAELLNVRAPAAGQVVNWQLRQNLLRRPVQRGQNLMTIIDPDTNWQCEIEVPERRVSHLISAMRSSEEPLVATFTLASHPGTEFAGHVLSIDNKLDVHSDIGNAMLVRIEFDKSQVPLDLLRNGTRVTAQIHAGSRSLGYVWFHEFFETVQATWMLWF